MTAQQIRQRCEQFLIHHPIQFDGAGISGGVSVDATVALYREAIAQGLELAAHSADTCAFIMGNDRYKERNALNDHADACRDQAKAFKEGRGC